MCSLHFLFPVFSSWMVHGLSYSDSQSLGRMFRQNLVETELCLKESFSKIGDKSLSYIILLCIYIYTYIHAFLISGLLMVYPSWHFGVAAAHHFLVAHPLNLKNSVFRVGSTVFKCNRLHPGNCSNVWTPSEREGSHSPKHHLYKTLFENPLLDSLKIHIFMKSFGDFANSGSLYILGTRIPRFRTQKSMVVHKSLKSRHLFR